MTPTARLRPHAFRDAAGRSIFLRAVRGGWLGRLAAEVGLSHLLDRLWDEREEVELAIYRAWHAAAVRTASPLALDLLRHQGLDVDETVRLLRPDGSSRRWICGAGVRDARSLDLAGMMPMPGAIDDDRARIPFLHAGHELRPWSDPEGALGIRLGPGGLEVGARISDAHLRTIGGEATLTIGAEVPATVRIAALGRRVGEVFAHPVFEDRAYLIHWSGDYVGDGGEPPEVPPWRVRFRVDPVAWRVPWA